MRARATRRAETMDARAAERRGWPRRHFPGHGQRPGGDDHAGLSRTTIRAASPRSARCRSCWWSDRRAPIASPAYRRCGIPALASLAMQEVGDAEPSIAARRRARSTGCRPSSCSMSPATGSVDRPNLAGGGWAFQFANDYYPDLDDTAVVAWAMHQARECRRLRGERSRARSTGWWACRAGTAASPRSMRTTPLTT